MAKRYSTIVADPPWEMPDSGPRTASERGGWREAKWIGTRSTIPYPRMTLEEIAELPVSELADRNAHLYIWTTNRFLYDTYPLVRGWGFEPSTLLTWCKAPMGLGMGGTFVNTTEYVLFARRGTLKATTRVDTTWWQWKRGKHSAKPEAFMDIVESVSPAPRLEMFSRRARIGWDTWGDQALHGTELVA